MTALAYVNGPSTVPLIGQTIGENLAATVAAHGDRDALIDVPTGRRWTYRELAADVEAVAWACCPSASRRATGWASGRRTCRSGC